MKVAVFGNYGVKNLGDDLILRGFLDAHQGDEVIVYCGNPKEIREKHGLKAYPFFPGGFRSLMRKVSSGAYRRQLQKGYEALKSVDRIYIGGGGILVDRRLKAVGLWWRQLKVISRTGKPFEFIANSMELRRSWTGKLFKKYLAKADKISVRDSRSKQFIESMGLKAELVEDLAAGIKVSGAGSREKKICLALCRWGLNKKELVAIHSFIERRRGEGYRVVGLVFQSEGDDDSEVYRKLDPGIVLKTELEDVLQELASCHLLIGMRFHSIVLALKLKTPFIAIAYQDKVTNLCRDRGMMDYCLPLADLNDNNLEALFKKSL